MIPRRDLDIVGIMYDSLWDENPNTGCWEWQKATNSAGYGQKWYEGKVWLSHRLMYRHVIGPVDGVVICHSCDNPICVNPRHLFQGSQTDNMQDCSRKGRANTGERCPTSVLTEDQVREIRSLSSLPHGQLALRFGVSRSNISMILARKSWAHI